MDSNNNSNHFHPEDEDEQLQKIFPLATSWQQLYAFVLVELVLVILGLYFFSWVYS